MTGIVNYECFNGAVSAIAGNEIWVNVVGVTKRYTSTYHKCQIRERNFD